MQKLIGSVTAIALLAAAHLAAAGDLDARQRYWEERLARELPTGSDLATVEKFFVNAHLEHSYDASSNTVYGVERDISGSLVRWSVVMKCTLGPTQGLQGCTAKAVGTGP
jgi:hypothetical protein